MLVMGWELWHYRQEFVSWTSSFVFNGDNLIDFLSVCIGVNAVGSVEQFQSFLVTPLQRNWQPLQNNINSCLQDYMEKLNELSENQRSAVDKAVNPNKLKNDFDNCIDFHISIINNTFYGSKLLSRGCVLLCVIFTFIAGSDNLVQNRALFVIFLFPPFFLVSFSLIYLALHLCYLKEKLCKQAAYCCQNVYNYNALVTNIQNLQSKNRRKRKKLIFL